jgi:hypothetical protein
MLNDAKWANIPWQSIHDLSRRCRSNDARSGGERYPTMTASPAVNASIYSRLAMPSPIKAIAGVRTEPIPPPSAGGVGEICRLHKFDEVHCSTEAYLSAARCEGCE